MKKIIVWGGIALVVLALIAYGVFGLMSDNHAAQERGGVIMVALLAFAVIAATVFVSYDHGLHKGKRAAEESFRNSLREERGKLDAREAQLAGMRAELGEAGDRYDRLAARERGIEKKEDELRAVESVWKGRFTRFMKQVPYERELSRAQVAALSFGVPLLAVSAFWASTGRTFTSVLLEGVCIALAARFIAYRGGKTEEGILLYDAHLEEYSYGRVKGRFKYCSERVVRIPLGFQGVDVKEEYKTKDGKTVKLSWRVEWIPNKEDLVWYYRSTGAREGVKAIGNKMFSEFLSRVDVDELGEAEVRAALEGAAQDEFSRRLPETDEREEETVAERYGFCDVRVIVVTLTLPPDVVREIELAAAAKAEARRVKAIADEFGNGVPELQRLQMAMRVRGHLKEEAAKKKKPSRED